MLTVDIWLRLEPTEVGRLKKKTCGLNPNISVKFINIGKYY